MKVQSTGNQHRLYSPNEPGVTYGKKCERDVAPNQVSQDPFSKLVTLKFLEPAANQELTQKTRGTIWTATVFFLTKPIFVLAEWKHSWRIEEGVFLGKTFPKAPVVSGVFNSASTDLIKGAKGCQADFGHFRFLVAQIVAPVAGLVFP